MCGASAPRGYNIGHHSNCPELQDEPVAIPRHTFGGARLMTDKEKAIIAEGRKAMEREGRISGISDKQYREAYDEVIRLRAALTAALEDNRRLRKALGPWLELLRDFDDRPDEEAASLCGPSGFGEREVKLGDLRRARAVYEEGK